MTTPTSSVSIDAQSSLLEFCEDTLKSIQTKKGVLKDDESQMILSLHEEQCKATIGELTKLSSECGEHAICKYLGIICKLILDFTYVEECDLVEQHGLENTTWERVRGVLDALNSVEKLASRALPTRDLNASLGEDIVECIWWRKGALLYMYCHMSQGNTPTHYLKCLEEGVDYLLSMLCARATPGWLGGDKEEEEAGKQDLASEGIWSDNHLLAMVYCGEMCYWHTYHIQTCPEAAALEQLSLEESRKEKKESANDEDNKEGQVASTVASSNDIDIAKTGKVCLDKFVTVAKWPMMAGSWNTKRAEKLLAYLSK